MFFGKRMTVGGDGPTKNNPTQMCQSHGQPAQAQLSNATSSPDSIPEPVSAVISQDSTQSLPQQRPRSAASVISFEVGKHYWFDTSSTTRRNPEECFAGEVTEFFRGKVTWTWVFNPDQSETRFLTTLCRQGCIQVSQADFDFLNRESAYSLRDINELKLRAQLPIQQQLPHQQYSFQGFFLQNHTKWSDILFNWLPNFDPLIFLSRRINSEPPTGEAKRLWVQCVKALTI